MQSIHLLLLDPSPLPVLAPAATKLQPLQRWHGVPLDVSGGRWHGSRWWFPTHLNAVDPSAAPRPIPAACAGPCSHETAASAALAWGAPRRLRRALAWVEVVVSHPPECSRSICCSLLRRSFTLHASLMQHGLLYIACGSRLPVQALAQLPTTPMLQRSSFSSGGHDRG